MEDVRKGSFGANYGGESPETKYYVECPQCGEKNFLPSRKLNSTVMKKAHQQR